MSCPIIILMSYVFILYYVFQVFLFQVMGGIYHEAYFISFLLWCSTSKPYVTNVVTKNQREDYIVSSLMLVNYQNEIWI